MKKSNAIEKPSEQIATPVPEKKKECANEPNEAVRVILSKNPQYAELWINSKGFAFVPETSPNMYGDAVLYKNPYYKQNQ